LRFLADENIPQAVILSLRSRGIDVAAVQEACLGASDAEVLALAASERRVLLTFDKDFGALARLPGPPRPAGVVLFRLSLARPLKSAASIAESAHWIRSDMRFLVERGHRLAGELSPARSSRKSAVLMQHKGRCVVLGLRKE
jgi:predicted nuclease of predicted toxin-antitoxin system